MPTTRRNSAASGAPGERRLALQRAGASGVVRRQSGASQLSADRAAAAPPRAYRSAMTTMRRAQRALAMIGVAFALAMSVSYVIPNAQAVEVSAEAQVAAEHGAVQDAAITDASLASVTVARDGYSVTLPPPPPPPPTLKPKAIPAAVRFTLTPSSSSAALQWPVAPGTRIASGFGARSCAGCSSFHEGVDLSAPSGSPVWAIAAGTVVETSNPGYSSLGVYAKIQHIIDGEVITSTYAHMIDGSRTVKVGDQVVPGQVIGAVGCTGRCTGTHLHFEIRYDGVPVDPVAWFATKLG